MSDNIKDVEDSFFISKHPCMQSNSVCCLNDYADLYHIGSFANNISTEIGSCDIITQNQDTLEFFSLKENALDQVLQGIL